MEFGTTPAPSIRSFPSKRSLLFITVLGIFAVGGLVAYGLASFAATTTSTTTSTSNSSTSS
ncbi:MAG TPA: hypothetical protein VN739_04695 [Nitrososphaerales archaeon]|nr:hypothetical protein [Nitrososphaerales archaeon]